MGGWTDRDFVGFVSLTTWVKEFGGGVVGEGAFVTLISPGVLILSAQCLMPMLLAYIVTTLWANTLNESVGQEKLVVLAVCLILRL